MRYILRQLFHFVNDLTDMLKLKIRFGNAVITHPLDIFSSNFDNIHISDGVVIKPKCIIRIFNDCQLFIGKDTYIGPCCHISGTQSNIIIGREVVISDRVFISSTTHRYDDVVKPVNKQGFMSKGDVVIGDGCWLGIGACILTGVKIGKHSVIGANAVVTHDIPSYSVAVGSPARVIKKYDFRKERWTAV